MDYQYYRRFFMFPRFLLTLFVLSIINISYADNRSPDSRKFTQLIEDYQSACLSSPCQEPFHTKVLYKKRNDVPALLTRPQIRFLNRIAVKQAFNWADTILEGDYISDGNTTLEKVIGIYKYQRLVAYKISYTEVGWDVSNCDYDFKNSESLKNCPVGVIRESSFVSLDLENFVRNHDDIADFYQDIIEK